MSNYPPPPLPSHPVYIVISKHDFNTTHLWQQYGLPNTILRVIKCDWTEIEDYWKAVVNPLFNMGTPGLETKIYSVAADEPFGAVLAREQAGELARTLATVDRILGQTEAELEEHNETGWLPGDE